MQDDDRPLVWIEAHECALELVAVGDRRRCVGDRWKVGDVVDVGDLSGEVSRIGIRASRVRTWQGAEIIVPNAQLITERVTNWTLSLQVYKAP